MPRLRSRVGKGLLRLIGRDENYRVKLDPISSSVWEQCGGNMSVGDIAEVLKNRFGDEIEPTYERLGKLIEIMERNRMIELRE